MNKPRRKHWSLNLLFVITVCGGGFHVADAEERTNSDHFEKRVRPLLIERCFKCHAGKSVKGKLWLDSVEGLRRGGESGAVIVAGMPEESLLIQAVQHQGGLKMPPDGKLTEGQIGDLVAWIKAGAVWPVEGTAAAPTKSSKAGAATIQPVAPNEGELAKSLQLWLRADALTLADGDPVYVWPDASGHGRDVSATKGIRTDGVGLPAKFAKESTLLRRPAVRFETTTGLASSPSNPVDIRGDAALSLMLVINLQPSDAQSPYDGVFGIGNPANPGGDPGRPLAALVQINRGEDHALHFAGGWNHDASLGSGSFKPFYGKTIILTVTKQPGPMRTATRLFINGEAAHKPDGSLDGRDTVPDIQHRSDIGAYLGKAVSWAGSIRGDIGEVIVYNKALSETERLAVEASLAEKFGLALPALQPLAERATFTPEEKSFWAYQPVQDFAPPSVKQEAWIKSPVDRFILAKLEEQQQNIAPAPQADKVTLLRRVTFDLIGLPPTPAEVDAFLQDDSPQAFEKVVNRLLDSPHYGERWGRHWLDVVRYAETTANDANAVMRFAWRYRNYVIEAFNRDLPYDQFVIEQLAGDLLPPTDSVETNTRRIIATGYLMIGPKALAETDKEQSRLDIVDDQIDVTGRAFLGLTVACARCHDHKFDAIRATDYYALAGIFRSTEPFQNEARNASMWWEFPISQGAGKEDIVVMAPKETLPRNLRVHLRGNRFTLGATVPRGTLQVLASSSSRSRETSDRTPTSSATSQDAAAPLIGSLSSSGRLELAQWIASKHNPLTARVMVNRIWQHHFVRGIVATSDNFGMRGDRPSHPELLDWLAARFVDSGWSLKAMHRLMLLSATYQQATFSRCRLSAEELRDAVLAVSGKLDRVPGSSESGEFLISEAEDIKAQIRPNRVAADHPYYSQFAKRSVYLPMVRNMLPDVLTLFDAADPNGVTSVRNDTTVPSQSLFLLNSPFVREQSKHFAQRLLSDDKLSTDQRIAEAHRLAFGRTASAAELQQGREFLAAYVSNPLLATKPEAERLPLAWQSYCQTLFCANEFLYVE